MATPSHAPAERHQAGVAVIRARRQIRAVAGFVRASRFCRAVATASRGLERRVSLLVPARAMRSAGAWLDVAIPQRSWCVVPNFWGLF